MYGERRATVLTVLLMNVQILWTNCQSAARTQQLNFESHSRKCRWIGWL